MKKLFLAIGLLFSGSAFGITHTIVNATPGAVQVQLDLRMAQDMYIPLQPGEIKEVYVGAFPLRSVTAKALSGPLSGKEAPRKRIFYLFPWGRTILVGISGDELVIK